MIYILGFKLQEPEGSDLASNIYCNFCITTNNCFTPDSKLPFVF